MELREFAEMVRRMRQKQRDYFGWHGQAALVRAIVEEDKVDRVLKDILDAKQLPLYEEGPG